jgi:hypothetical protein
MKKTIVKVTAAGPNAGDRVNLNMSLTFDASSPTAPKVWRGLVLMLQELLTTEELHEFVRQLDRERAKLPKKSARSGCLKCHGAGIVDRGNGSTKPCDCTAGSIEAGRRRFLARVRKRKEPQS